MALPITVPFTFGNATTTQSLSSLDADFSTVYNAVNGIGNGTVSLANVSITGGTVSANITSSSISSGTSNVSITSANGPVSINTNGNNAVYVNASGNVGIGTSLPAVKFAIEQNQSAYSYFDYNNITNGGGVVWRQVVRNIDNTGTTSVDFAKLIGGGFAINNNDPNASNYTSFSVGGSERMRIDSSGNLLVGTTTSGGKVFSYQNSAATNIGIDCGASMGANAALWTRVASTSTVLAYYLYNATNVGSITTNGTTTSYNVSSDYRLKEKVTSLTSGLSTISRLNPVAYEWISDKSQGEGFIAHELQAVIPHAVFGEKDAVNDDGSIKPQGVDYSKIVVHLVAAIQELSAKNDALEARLSALESK